MHFLSLALSGGMGAASPPCFKEPAACDAPGSPGLLTPFRHGMGITAFPLFGKWSVPSLKYLLWMWETEDN